MPLKRMPAGGFILEIRPKERLKSIWCLWCGGRNSTEAKERERYCTCGFLQRVSQMGGVISFAEGGSEYELTITDQENHVIESHLIAYCPACGGKTPESTRDNLFYDITEDDIEPFRQLLKSARVIEDVIALLGPAVRTSGPYYPTELDRKLYGMVTILREATFSPSGVNFVIDVQELEGGILEKLYVPKRKSESPA